MKRGARLINVGRGSLLDEAALVQHWRLARWAARRWNVTQTDTFAGGESVVEDAELFITPHTSGVSDGSGPASGDIDRIAGAMV